VSRTHEIEQAIIDSLHQAIRAGTFVIPGVFGEVTFRGRTKRSISFTVGGLMGQRQNFIIRIQEN
jgi:hypothetical protein